MDESGGRRARRIGSPRPMLNDASQQSVQAALKAEADGCPGDARLEALKAMLMACFTIEAMLNFYGQHAAQKRGDGWGSVWAGIERLPAKEKCLAVAALSETDGRPDLGAEPFQPMHEMFQFRQRVAHGKPIKKECALPEGVKGAAVLSLPELQEEWEKACTPANAERFQRAAYEMTLWFAEHTPNRPFEHVSAGPVGRPLIGE